MHRTTRFALSMLSIAVTAAAAVPSVTSAQAVPRPAAGSTASSGSSSSGSSGGGSSEGAQSGNPRTAGASEGQSSRQPSSAGRVTGSAVSRGGSATPSRPSGSGVSSGSSSSSSEGSSGSSRRTGVTVDNRTTGVGRASRDRNSRPVTGTAVERPHADVTVVNFPYFGPWGRWFPYFGTGYGWGHVSYDPFNYYGGTRWGWNRYGWYDGYDGYGGYGGYGSYGGYGGYRRYDSYDEPEDAPRAAMGSIRLRANPSTARVYVNGALVGTVDDFDGLSGHLELEVGTHQIELRLEGYETYQGEVTVEADRTRTERVNLKKIK